ncbi:MAG: CDP-diacylglycerol--glycerol-3-phosphate 3-phosphatidyltransferase [Ignavibacteriae bacterium]|nr:CDP-diacylglycerol--glycerol-3-phosphate 3-phosphatidyltransferase [Ignavibacteriota bacterium]
MNVPNVLSVIRILLSPVFLFLFLTGDMVLQRVSLVIFFIAVLTDWYDGWYARKYKSITKTGIFLDPLADKILTTFAFILFYIKGMLPLWMLIIIAVRDIAITLLRSYDENKGLTIKTSKIAKVKTFLQMTYIFFILALFILPSYNISDVVKNNIGEFLFNSGFNYILMLIVTLVTLYTGISYFFEKRHYAKNEID